MDAVHLPLEIVNGDDTAVDGAAYRVAQRYRILGAEIAE